MGCSAKIAVSGYNKVIAILLWGILQGEEEWLMILWRIRGRFSVWSVRRHSVNLWVANCWVKIVVSLENCIRVARCWRRRRRNSSRVQSLVGFCGVRGLCVWQSGRKRRFFWKWRMSQSMNRRSRKLGSNSKTTKNQ